MHTSTIALGLLVAGLLIGSNGQAAPILPPEAKNSPLVEMPAVPEVLSLDKLKGNEFPSAAANLSASDAIESSGKKNKKGFKVPEPNGLILLGLGICGIGALRLRVKSQAQ
jgi:hypothetical protein